MQQVASEAASGVVRRVVGEVVCGEQLSTSSVRGSEHVDGTTRCRGTREQIV